MSVRRKDERQFEFEFTACKVASSVFDTGMGWGFRVEFIDFKIVISHSEQTYDSRESAEHAVNIILLDYFDSNSKFTVVYTGK